MVSMNTLEIEKQLAWTYGCKPLSKAVSKEYRELFTANIPEGLSLSGANNQLLFTKNGIKSALAATGLL